MTRQTCHAMCFETLARVVETGNADDVESKDEVVMAVVY